MTFRDRIKELRRVPASKLVPHERNWREHPPVQADAMTALLEEIGYADALLVRELSDDHYQIIDGHLRAEVSPQQSVPVLVLDLDPTEADQLLLTHDPLASMAAANGPLLEQLMATTTFNSPAVRPLLDDLNQRLQSQIDDTPNEIESNEPSIGAMFQVAVQCRDESEQESLFRRLTDEGYACRLLTM